MKILAESSQGRFSNWYKYLLLAVIGLLILLACSAIQHVRPAAKGEYHFSTLFRNNLTLFAKILFIVTGFLVGYNFRLNPWYTGISLFLVFPLTSIIEAAVYAGSHNLIPFESIIFLVYALPSIAASYVGKLTYMQVSKRKAKVAKQFAKKGLAPD